METPWLQRNRPAVLVVVACLPLMWCALAAHLRDDVTAATAALVIVLLVVAAAATGDRWAGIVSAISGGIWFDFFLAAPFNRFTVDDPDNVEVTVLLVLVGIAVTEIALWGRRQQAKASSRAGYLDGVLTTSQIVAGELSSTALAGQVAAHLTDLLGVDACRFVTTTTVSSDSAVLLPDGNVTVREIRINVDRDGLPSMEETVIPAQHHGIVRGQFLITAATQLVRPTIEQRRVAVLHANQVGAAYAADPLDPRPR
jgi:K+-sensing histidine kinase KdpD